MAPAFDPGEMTPYLAPFMCFLGALTVAVSYNVPKRALLLCGLLGNVAWYTEIACSNLGLTDVASNFLGAFTVALLAEALARLQRLPVTCLAAPGVIPLVPGFKAYNALLLYVSGSYDQANEKLLEALLIAAAVSAALATASSFVALLPGVQQPWRNPQSPVDDRVLTTGAMHALKREVIARATGEIETPSVRAREASPRGGE